MTLSEYVALNPAATLQDVHDYTEVKGKIISPDMMVSFMATFQILRAVNAEDSEAAEALRSALQFGSEFNLTVGHPSSVEPLLNQIACATSEFKAYVLAYANPIVNPLSEVTQVQLNQVKGVYTEKSVENYSGQDIKVTIDSPHDCIVTTWDLTEFGYENFGKVGHVKSSSNITRVKTNGKSAEGVLYVRVPLENASITVELI